jgi:hypothetical protein
MEEIKKPLTMLESAIKMHAEGNRPQAIDLIYDTIDDLLIERKLDEVIDIINQAINIKEKLAPSMHLSIIIMSNPEGMFHQNIPTVGVARSMLIKELRKHWNETLGIEETDELLWGFEDEN